MCPPNSSIEAKRELLNPALAKRSTQRLTLMLKSFLRSTLTEHFKRFAKLKHAFYYLSGPKGETTSGSNPCLGFHEQHDTT